MALIKCKECGHDVSTAARVCQNCDTPDYRAVETTADQLLGKPQKTDTGSNTDAKAKKVATTAVTIGCLIPIFIIAIIVVWIMIASLGNDGEKESSIATLKASVRFTGTQIIITNNGRHSWLNVKMEINPGLLRGGYALEHPIIKGGETYTVGILQFAKSDGTRFNPIGMKVQKFSIISRDSNNMPKGSWYGEWK